MAFVMTVRVLLEYIQAIHRYIASTNNNYGKCFINLCLMFLACSK